jgi:hypothetical protein
VLIACNITDIQKNANRKRKSFVFFSQISHIFSETIPQISHKKTVDFIFDELKILTERKSQQFRRNKGAVAKPEDKQPCKGDRIKFVQAVFSNAPTELQG